MERLVELAHYEKVSMKKESVKIGRSGVEFIGGARETCFEILSLKF